MDTTLLARVLWSRDMAQAELARAADLSTKHVSQLVNGRVPMTPAMALLLEEVLGVPAAHFLREDIPRALERARSVRRA